MPAQRAQRGQPEPHRRVAGDGNTRHEKFVRCRLLSAGLSRANDLDLVPAQPQPLFLGLHGEGDAVDLRRVGLGDDGVAHALLRVWRSVFAPDETAVSGR
jgi:hypothetical protein